LFSHCHAAAVAVEAVVALGTGPAAAAGPHQGQGVVVLQLHAELDPFHGRRAQRRRFTVVHVLAGGRGRGRVGRALAVVVLAPPQEPLLQLGVPVVLHVVVSPPRQLCGNDGPPAHDIC